MSGAPARWLDLRRFTPARVALGRAGNGLPTAAHLAFQAAHAAARDAVHAPLDVPALLAALAQAGIDGRAVRTACPDRPTYLRRPDLGRQLDAADRAAIAAAPVPGATVFVLCDGLSPAAVQSQAVPLLAAVLPALHEAAVVVVATQARVALGDEVGEALGADAAVVLIGERPGLSAPESLGAYLTWSPRRGRSDAERNCISNIRPGGMPGAIAAAKLLWLLGEMRRLRRSGVCLKDEQPSSGVLPSH